MAKKKAASMAIVAMVRCLEKGANPIIGLPSKERVDEAVDVVKMAKEGLFTKEDIAYLEEAYIPKLLSLISYGPDCNVVSPARNTIKFISLSRKSDQYLAAKVRERKCVCATQKEAIHTIYHFQTS